MALRLSPLAVLNRLADLGGHERIADIAYGPDPRHRLDLYRPAGATGAEPVAVFFHGGSWEEGDKAMYRFVGAALAGRGFLTVVPNYRLYPQVRFPAFLEDAARAVAFVHGHPEVIGHIVHLTALIGHSAGAHIAAMLSYDRRWLGAVGLDPARHLSALAGLAGPYDFLPLTSPTLRDIFTTDQGLEATQPIRFVDGGGPPAFLAAGARDVTVDPGNSTRLAARLRAHGVGVEHRVYRWADHRTLLGALSPSLYLVAPVLDDMTAFIRPLSNPPGLP
ncbi:alpha/beta hydrolase [Ancylobacter lacus]|uniref:alpha/beta hydrolase n=1 Tax=Ancylobacter lacus TaxID=2579970 RepID=UPI001BCCF3B2|nr:alpha/beta hydrolase [Ancylobacter lacus]MBS7539507.1 alpha/beta hydrolase [Ancylobacter lacus]